MNIGRVTYHRNGVGGEGFFTVEFRHHADGWSGRRLLGIVGDLGDDEVSGNGLVAVVDPDEPSLRWRGHDYFADQLRHACEIASLTGEAYVH